MSNHIVVSKALLTRSMRNLCLLVLASTFWSLAYADGASDHVDKKPAPANSMMMDKGHMENDSGHADQRSAAEHGKMMNKGQMMDEGVHGHNQWVAPPPEYAALASRDWDDQAASQRGSKIFEAQCIVCHGMDGRGTGVAAAALDHKPANLTNHFHKALGQGDAYLFWRVSEGGTVEPFRSQNSTMPAFKSMLSEQDRWDVLTYVHNVFHRSFLDRHDEDKGKGSADSH